MTEVRIEARAPDGSVVSVEVSADLTPVPYQRVLERAVRAIAAGLADVDEPEPSQPFDQDAAETQPMRTDTNARGTSLDQPY